MVKLFRLALYNKDNGKVKELAGAADVSSFSYFTRGSVEEFLRFLQSEAIELSLYLHQLLDKLTSLSTLALQKKQRI